MRDIRFRAYGAFGSNAEKAMVEDWQDTEYVESVGFDGGEYFEVMQYTGLHDKNGVEICEGDYIDHGDLTAVVLPIDYYEDIGPEFLGFACLMNGREYGFDKSVARGQIIGNIHENAELLKSKD